jgi:hypothetical protein
MNKDSLDDLRRFVPTESWHSRRQFIESAEKRLRQGGHSYTRVEDGILVSYGWMAQRQSRTYLSEARQWYELPPNTAVLYDFYTHPAYRARGFYASSLLQGLHDAAAVPGTEVIFACVLADNAAPRWWVEKFGGVYQGSLIYDKVLWYEKCSSTAVTDNKSVTLK